MLIEIDIENENGYITQRSKGIQEVPKIQNLAAKTKNILNL
jgi:hypothetical protein